MTYVLFNRNGGRSEFAQKATPANRVIHRADRTTRKVGTCNESVYQTQFSVIQPKVVKTDTCNIELPESVKVQFSTSNLESVKAIWAEAKKQIDKAIASSPEVFSGLPLVDIAQ